jgi:hypothetical protein
MTAQEEGRGAAFVYGKTSGKRVTSKLMPKENGFRVWRTH